MVENFKYFITSCNCELSLDTISSIDINEVIFINVELFVLFLSLRFWVVLLSSELSSEFSFISAKFW